MGRGQPLQGSGRRTVNPKSKPLGEGLPDAGIEIETLPSARDKRLNERHVFPSSQDEQAYYNMFPKRR